MKRDLIIKRFFAIVFLTPFMVSIILLIFYLSSISKLSLQPAFNINFEVVLSFTILHYLIIIFLIKKGKIGISFGSIFGKLRITIPLVLLFGYSMLVVSLLIMSLKMNLNYWLKQDFIESITITIDDKRYSHGRSGTDYYLDFKYDKGSLNYKVSKSKFDKFNVGETFEVEVKKGYYEGYFLTKELY